MTIVFSRCFRVFAILVALGYCGPSYANVLAESRFDTDSDGWLVKDLAYPNPGVPPAPIGTFSPVYHGAGGNPGGYLSLLDPTANAWYWHAPAKFLGNKLGAYGATLSFDLALTGNGVPFDEEDVILVGGGVTLVFTLPARPSTTLTTYHIGLTETGWRRDTRSGAPATQLEMQTVLGALTALYIRGEYLLSSDDVGSIDNVVLEGTAICDIQLNNTTFVNGEQVTAPVLRIANQQLTPLQIEFKMWLEVPGIAPIPYVRGGADGSVVLPAGLNVNIGPRTLFTVTPALPRGAYAFSCRFMDPVTGKTLIEDLNPFVIQ